MKAYFWCISCGKNKEDMRTISGIDMFDDRNIQSLRNSLDEKKMEIMKKYSLIGGPYHMIVNSFNRVM